MDAIIKALAEIERAFKHLLDELPYGVKENTPAGASIMEAADKLHDRIRAAQEAAEKDGKSK